jgi:enoyl-[acyl-carrier protein] reductase I
MIDMTTLPLLKGKKALVAGIANDQSIAYGCAKAFRAFGADLAITYRSDKARFVELLRNPHRFSPLDVQVDGQLRQCSKPSKSNGASSTSASIRRLCPKADLQAW